MPSLEQDWVFECEADSTVMILMCTWGSAEDISRVAGLAPSWKDVNSEGLRLSWSGKHAFG